MDEKVHQEAQEYFSDVGRLLNDDRKYVKEAERIGSMKKVEQDMNTEFRCYEIKYRIQTRDNFDFNNRDHIKKVFENHFGSWFALLDGGSSTIPVESVKDNEFIIKVRYVSSRSKNESQRI
jgi:hypothetical protein